MISILVPTIALDISLLERLDNSFDYPVDSRLLISNGDTDAVLKWKAKSKNEWKVMHTNNLGVAGSWNIAPEYFSNDHWLIINDDHELVPGALEKICKAVENNPGYDIYYVNQYEAFDIFVWTRQAVEKFGLFDENFFPAYFEDWEYRLRLNLGKAKTFIIEESFHVKHGKPKPAGELYSAMLAKVKPINEDYFMRKWGIIGDKDPVFKTPFNGYNFPLSYWTLEQERRHELTGIWEEFFNHPNVSLY